MAFRSFSFANLFTLRLLYKERERERDRERERERQRERERERHDIQNEANVFRMRQKIQNEIHELTKRLMCSE